MRNDPYRHSVWIDVFGVLLFGAVLLGGAGYLLSHAGGAARSLAVGTSRSGGQVLSGQRYRRAPVRRGGSRGGLANSPPTTEPLLGERRGRGESAEVPFSKEWRERATPRLSEPAGSSGGGLGGGGGGAAPDPSGPAIASSRPSGLQGGGSSWAGRTHRNPGSSWRAEARRLAGRARALSGVLGQMARESSGQGKGEASSRRASAASASAASASSSDRDVPSPPSVPIDDHVYWLAIAGLLWGTWRLWGG